MRKLNRSVKNGKCNISLGTSGTIFIAQDNFSVDKNNALHSFCHANGGYHLMGCILSAASCNNWFCEKILKTTDYSGAQSEITEEKLGNTTAESGRQEYLQSVLNEIMFRGE